MKNFKFILGFAIFGFLLSFVAGLFSGSGIGSVFLNAVIFAAVFFCLALGIQLLFSKVFQAEQDSAALEQPSRTQEAANPSHVVDIVIQDEDLPSEENAPGFFVGTSRNMLNSADMNVPKEHGSGNAGNASESAKGAAVSEAPVPTAAQKEFVPVRLADAAPNVSERDAKPAKEIANDGRPSQPAPSASGAGEEMLDVLPDLESIAGSSSEQEFENDISSGANYSSDEEVVKPAARVSGGSVGNDAALMAKAITTLLAGDR